MLHFYNQVVVNQNRALLQMKTIRINILVIMLAVSMLLVSNTLIADLSNKGVVHTVFLWLKAPGDEQHRQQLLSATERLRQIPGVIDMRMGVTITSDRGIVDDSFDVGIYFYFNDIAAMKRYLADPLHQKIVEQEIQPLVQRIIVHDFHDSLIE